MKKLSIVALLMFAAVAMNAQHMPKSFFDAKGTVRFETQELDEAADTLTTVFHRSDDVVWSRVVYRVIDMRYKQNYQLYFPTSPSDPQYRSLFKVLIDAIIDGMPVYGKPDFETDIQPHFENAPLTKPEMVSLLNTDEEGSDAVNMATSEFFIINYDSVQNLLTFNNYSYDNLVKNQLKWMIQEIVFFDKHYSRMYSKVIGIAPMLANRAGGETTPITDALYQSILFWVVYDDFRPYMAKQYIIPDKNDNRRVTFEQFFAQHLYTSYLIGDSNMYDRIFSDFASKGLTYDSEEDRLKIEEAMKKEQQRVQDELLNFELDLWEY